MAITIYGWSTNGAAPQPDESCRGCVGWAGSGQAVDGALSGP
jgi:hypothetical protein